MTWGRRAEIKRELGRKNGKGQGIQLCKQGKGGKVSRNMEKEGIL